MVKKIESKIVAYKVKTKEELEKQQQAEVVHMHETVQRPEKLMGTTYKLKTPSTSPSTPCLSPSTTWC